MCTDTVMTQLNCNCEIIVLGIIPLGLVLNKCASIRLRYLEVLFCAPSCEPSRRVVRPQIWWRNCSCEIITLWISLKYVCPLVFEAWMSVSAPQIFSVSKIGSTFGWTCCDERWLTATRSGHQRDILIIGCMRLSGSLFILVDVFYSRPLVALLTQWTPIMMRSKSSIKQCYHQINAKHSKGCIEPRGWLHS